MANTPTTFEKKWPTVILTPIGVADHVVTVSSTAGLHTKAIVALSAVGQETVEYEIKRVLNDTQLQVGLTGTAINKIEDPVQFDGGMLTMSEQKRTEFGADIVLRAVYQEEPAVALRNVLVNQYGAFVDTIIDSHGINRLAVDGMFTAEVDVQVDVDIQGEYNASTNPDPDDIGVILSSRNSSPGKINQIQRPTAKRGTSDTDTVSMDVSLHDEDGNKYSDTNPVPTENAGFDKYFQLVGASNWMKLANYDEVVPTYSGGGSVLTLAYKEDGALLGEAVITQNSDTDWSVKLNRYIDEDDGSPLQDDDGSYLNLD